MLLGIKSIFTGLVAGVSKYLIPILLVIIFVLGYSLRQAYSEIGEKEFKITSVEERNNELAADNGRFLGEIASLKLYIEQAFNDGVELKENSTSIEGRWAKLIEDSEKPKLTKETLKEEEIEYESDNTKPLDLSDQFKLLNESYCLTVESC
tara:strand:+ start:44729 stop:45181 length:453 start_codon:yes stop_codon:yes gene_type:complete